MADQLKDLAEVEIPRDPDQPILFDLNTYAIRAALVEREDVRALDPEEWNGTG